MNHENNTITCLPYKNVIDSLMYAMVSTRPDIAFTVSYLSRYLDKPEKKHLLMCKEILRYLKYTCDDSLKLDGNIINLVAYSDSDWANSKKIERV